jgi:phage tail tape-measure protein
MKPALDSRMGVCAAAQTACAACSAPSGSWSIILNASGAIGSGGGRHDEVLALDIRRGDVRGIGATLHYILSKPA